jgi:predicted nucleic acid-binding protein
MSAKRFFDTNILELRYWDSLIVAAARRAGCPEALSEDLSDGQDYGGVIVVNPFRQP